MKAYYFRECHYEKFLIPIEHIEEFDKLNEEMELADEDSDKEYELENEFNNKYWQYKCEGELYDTKLFIESGG